MKILMAETISIRERILALLAHDAGEFRELALSFRCTEADLGRHLQDDECRELVRNQADILQNEKARRRIAEFLREIDLNRDWISQIEKLAEEIPLRRVEDIPSLLARLHPPDDAEAVELSRQARLYLRKRVPRG